MPRRKSEPDRFSTLSDTARSNALLLVRFGQAESPAEDSAALVEKQQAYNQALLAFQTAQRAGELSPAEALQFQLMAPAFAGGKSRKSGKQNGSKPIYIGSTGVDEQGDTLGGPGGGKTGGREDAS